MKNDFQLSPPNETLVEAIEDLDLDREVVSVATNIALSRLDKILDDYDEMSQNEIESLAKYFDYDPEWLSTFQNKYREQQNELRYESMAIDVFATLKDISAIDINTGRRMRHSKYEKIASVKKFFGIEKFESELFINFKNDLLKDVAYKQSYVGKGMINELSVLAQLKIADSLANKYFAKANKFDTSNSQQLFDELKKFTLNYDIARFEADINSITNKYGIIVVFMPNIKGAKHSGLVHWAMDRKYAVINLTLRGAFEDSMWFSLFHEISHLVVEGKGDFEGFYKDGNSEREKLVNEYTADILIPKNEWIVYVNEGDFTLETVELFSKKVGIAKSIVVGRLMKEGWIGFDNPLWKQRPTFKFT